MSTRKAVISAGVIAVVVAFPTACELDLYPDPPPPTITAMKAYYCAQTGQFECHERGEEIPLGDRPPTNEAFQVWAWYNGTVTTRWLVLVAGLDSASVDKLAADSIYAWVHLNGGAAPYYTVRVMIRGAEGFLDEDSLRWDMPSVDSGT